MAPPAYDALFPPQSLASLSLVSQIGLTLYMFSVGLEFRSDLVFRAGPRAVTLSIAGIAGPFVLGSALSVILRNSGDLLTDHVTSVQAAVFIGTALSITAFPVLARIISERGIGGTTIGSLALTAGAVDDAAAWMMLAGLLGTLSGRMGPAIVAVGGGIGYAALVLIVVPSVLGRLGADHHAQEVSPAVLTTVLGALMLGAGFTESIGIHAVFGAFLFGVSFRQRPLAAGLRKLIEPLAATVFVPLFFATPASTHGSIC